MQFELGNDEVIVARHTLSAGDSGSEAVLTNRRLIVMAAGTRESYPLAHIQAVRLETGRHWGLAIALIVGIVTMLVAAMNVGVVMSEASTVPALAAQAGHGQVILAVGAALLAFLVFLTWLCLRGYARFVVHHAAEKKTYEASRTDTGLLVFVSAVEKAL